MNPWQMWTSRLLIVSGGFLMLATIPIFFPVGWMEWGHQQLGLGELDFSPIAIYLARSTSLMYAVHGAVTVYVGVNVVSMWPLVRVLGVLHVFIGLTMIGVDINASMPTYWTLGEGAPVAGLGLLLLFLWSKGQNSNQPVAS